MTRMSGVNGKEAWRSLPEDQRESVLAQVGEIIAEGQRVPLGDLSRLQPQWEQSIPRQIEGCRARHKRLGLPQKYLDQLDDFLRDATRLIPVNAAPVILTGEYNPENLFLEERSGRWRLAALIDFGDVMTGWGEYDLLGPNTFAAGGMPGRVRSLLLGSGIRKRTLILCCLGGLCCFFCFIGSAIWRCGYALRAGNKRPLTFMNWNDCSGRFDGGSSGPDSGE
jgi:hygromycin-B 7''-O-kinase